MRWCRNWESVSWHARPPRGQSLIGHGHRYYRKQCTECHAPLVGTPPYPPPRAQDGSKGADGAGLLMHTGSHLQIEYRDETLAKWFKMIGTCSGVQCLRFRTP